MWQWLLNHWLTQEKFWVAVGSIVTAAALVFTLLRFRSEHSRYIKGLRSSLEFELITNVDSIFSGGVDRPLLFNAIENLRNKGIGDIKDRNLLSKIQNLYIEMEHYRDFVDRVWLKPHAPDRRYVTERQLKVCNIFRTFFGLEEVSYEQGKLDHPDIGNAYIEERRDLALKEKSKDFDKWKHKIHKTIYEML